MNLRSVRARLERGGRARFTSLPAGPTANTGLRISDLLISANGEAVRSAQSLQRLMIGEAMVLAAAGDHFRPEGDEVASLIRARALGTVQIPRHRR